MIRLAPPPASVKLNALQHPTSVHAFDEAQNRTLTANLLVDAANPGTYSTYPAGLFAIGAGTVVDSHLIHSDPPASNFTSRRIGSVTFSDQILGVIATTSKLTSTINLGAPGTQYEGGTHLRGLENTEDKITISPDRRTLSFDIQTVTVMDEIRVITRHRSPLTTTITDSPDPVQVGNNVTYTVKITNTGNAVEGGIMLTDEFPGATLVSASAPGLCSGTTTVTCNIGTIQPGAFATATVVVKAPAAVPAGGTITNTATVPLAQGPASATTTVQGPMLSTTITDNPDPVTASPDPANVRNVQYTLTVKNIGLGPVTNAHVVDTLPAGTSLVSSTAPGGCVGSGPVDCTVGSLAVNATAQAVIVITSPATVPPGGTITDTAVASPGTNAPGSQTTTVEAPEDGVARGFVPPGGTIMTTGDDPATVTLPNTGSGAPILVTQGDGSFCDGPCTGPVTTISSFPGYTDQNNPIRLKLEYNFIGGPDPLTEAADAYASPIYKNDDPGNPNVGVVVPTCTALGIASPHPCVEHKTITSPNPGEYRVTFYILYLSGDPSFGKRR